MYEALPGDGGDMLDESIAKFRWYSDIGPPRDTWYKLRMGWYSLSKNGNRQKRPNDILPNQVGSSTHVYFWHFDDADFLDIMILSELLVVYWYSHPSYRGGGIYSRCCGIFSICMVIFEFWGNIKGIVEFLRYTETLSLLSFGSWSIPNSAVAPGPIQVPIFTFATFYMVHYCD